MRQTATKTKTGTLPEKRTRIYNEQKCIYRGDVLVLFKTGEFYEAISEDAVRISELYGLPPAYLNYFGFRIPVCRIESAQLGALSKIHKNIIISFGS